MFADYASSDFSHPGVSTACQVEVVADFVPIVTDRRTDKLKDYATTYTALCAIFTRIARPRGYKSTLEYVRFV